MIIFNESYLSDNNKRKSRKICKLMYGDMQINFVVSSVFFLLKTTSNIPSDQRGTLNGKSRLKKKH